MSDLLIKPRTHDKTYHSLTAEQAGWTYLNFEAKILEVGEQIVGDTGDYEYCFALLGGNFKIEAAGQTWETGNGRKDVFSGIGHAMYLSRRTPFVLTAQSPGYRHCDLQSPFRRRPPAPHEAPRRIRY
jgi:5-deoxy-glucuronate isomerase